MRFKGTLKWSIDCNWQIVGVCQHTPDCDPHAHNQQISNHNVPPDWLVISARVIKVGSIKKPWFSDVRYFRLAYPSSGSKATNTIHVY